MDAVKQAAYDASVARLYSILLVLHMTNNSVKQVLSIAPEAGGSISMLIGVIFVCFFIREVKNFNPSLFVRLAAWETVFLILYVISVLRYPDAQSAIMGRGVWTMAFCVPLACLAYGMRDTSRFFSKPMTIAAFVMFFEGVYVFWHNGILGLVGDAEYNMSFGYMLLLPTLYFIWHSYSNKWFALPAVVLLLLILLYASRGPLLFVALFVFLSFVGRQRGTNKILILFGAVIFCGILYLAFDSIVSMLVDLADQLGIQSRTLNKMLQGEEALTNLSGRDIIWRETEENIMRKPLLGWGVAGELSYMVSYPHHIILEMLLHYGLIAGGIIVLVVFGNILKGLIATKLRNPVILMFFCAGLCRLFLSGSYLMEPQFWILVALCLRHRQDYMLCVHKLKPAFK